VNIIYCQSDRKNKLDETYKNLKNKDKHGEKYASCTCGPGYYMKFVHWSQKLLSDIFWYPSQVTMTAL